MEKKMIDTLADELEGLADQLDEQNPIAFRSAGGHEICTDIRSTKSVVKNIARKSAMLARIISADDKGKMEESAKVVEADLIEENKGKA